MTPFIHAPQFPLLTLGQGSVGNTVSPAPVRRLTLLIGPRAYGWCARLLPWLPPCAADALSTIPWGPRDTSNLTRDEARTWLDMPWPRAENPRQAWRRHISGPNGLVDPVIEACLSPEPHILFYPETALDLQAQAGIGDLLVARTMAGWPTLVETQSEVIFRRVLAWTPFHPAFAREVVFVWFPEGRGEQSVELSQMNSMTWPEGAFTVGCDADLLWLTGQRARGGMTQEKVP